MPINKSYGQEMDKRTRELEKRNPKPDSGGQALQEQQLAQNQLQAIQNEQRSNLMSQRTEAAAMAQQNQLLSQAAELGVSSSTAATLGKYGMKTPPRVQRQQGRQVNVTPNKITIINNTNTTTTNNVQQPGGGGGGDNNSAAKFKTWLGKVNMQQAEQASKRDRDYARRESSLTRSANKMLRRIEKVGSSVAEAFSPQTFGQTIGSQLKMYLLIFGMRFLSKYWDKVLNAVSWIGETFDKFTAWLGFGDKGAAEAKQGRGLIPTVIRLFGGDPQKETVVDAFKNSLKAAFDHFAKKLNNMMEERAVAMKKVKLNVKTDGLLGGVLKGLGLENLFQGITTYLGDILTALVDPKAGAARQVSRDIQKKGMEGSNRNLNVGQYESESFGVDRGDLSVIDKNNKHRYGLVEGAVGPGNILTSKKGGQVSQSLDVLGALKDAQETGYVDPARFLAGLERMQDKARSDGFIAVDYEFLSTFLSPKEIQELTRAGHIRLRKYKVVKVKKSDAHNFGDYVIGGLTGGLIGKTSGANKAIKAAAKPVEKGLANATFKGASRAFAVTSKVATKGLGPAGWIGGGVISTFIDDMQNNDFTLEFVPLDDPREAYKGKVVVLYEIDEKVLQRIAKQFGTDRFVTSDEKLMNQARKFIYQQAGGFGATKGRWKGKGGNESISVANEYKTIHDVDNLRAAHKTEEENDEFSRRHRVAMNQIKEIGQGAVDVTKSAYQGTKDFLTKPTGEKEVAYSPTGYTTVGGYGARTADMIKTTQSPTPSRYGDINPYVGQSGKINSPTSTGYTFSTESAVKEAKRLSKLIIVQGESPNKWKAKAPSARDKSKCRETYARLAIAKGLGMTDLKEHPNVPCEFVDILYKYGFYPVSWEGFAPRKGDICIFGPTPKHPGGYISIYSGNKWISDFEQSEMWPYDDFKSERCATIFRHLKPISDKSHGDQLLDQYAPGFDGTGFIDFEGDGRWDAFKNSDGKIYKLNEDGTVGELMDANAVNSMLTSSSTFTSSPNTTYNGGSDITYNSSLSGAGGTYTNNISFDGGKLTNSPKVDITTSGYNLVLWRYNKLPSGAGDGHNVYEGVIYEQSTGNIVTWTIEDEFDADRNHLYSTTEIIPGGNSWPSQQPYHVGCSSYTVKLAQGRGGFGTQPGQPKTMLCMKNSPECLFHPGADTKWSKGCILIGDKAKNGKRSMSKELFLVNSIQSSNHPSVVWYRNFYDKVVPTICGGKKVYLYFISDKTGSGPVVDSSGNIINTGSPSSGTVGSSDLMSYSSGSTFGWTGEGAASGGGTTGGKITGEQAKQNAISVVNFLMKKGLTKEQALGVAGNIMGESGFNASAVGDNGTSGGLAQWHGSRFTALQSFASARGRDWRDPEIQMEYLWHELNTTEKGTLDKLRLAGSVEEASRVWGHEFERFAGYKDYGNSKYAERAAFARSVGEAYGVYGEEKGINFVGDYPGSSSGEGDSLTKNISDTIEKVEDLVKTAYNSVPNALKGIIPEKSENITFDKNAAEKIEAMSDDQLAAQVWLTNEQIRDQYEGYGFEKWKKYVFDKLSRKQKKRYLVEEEGKNLIRKTGSWSDATGKLWSGINNVLGGSLSEDLYNPTTGELTEEGLAYFGTVYAKLSPDERKNLASRLKLEQNWHDIKNDINDKFELRDYSDDEKEALKNILSGSSIDYGDVDLFETSPGTASVLYSNMQLGNVSRTRELLKLLGEYSDFDRYYGKDKGAEKLRSRNDLFGKLYGETYTNATVDDILARTFAQKQYQDEQDKINKILDEQSKLIEVFSNFEEGKQDLGAEYYKSSGSFKPGIGIYRDYKGATYFNGQGSALAVDWWKSRGGKEEDMDLNLMAEDFANYMNSMYQIAKSKFAQQHLTEGFEDILDTDTGAQAYEKQKRNDKRAEINQQKYNLEYQKEHWQEEYNLRMKNDEKFRDYMILNHGVGTEANQAYHDSLRGQDEMKEVDAKLEELDKLLDKVNGNTELQDASSILKKFKATQASAAEGAVVDPEELKKINMYMTPATKVFEEKFNELMAKGQREKKSKYGSELTAAEIELIRRAAESEQNKTATTTWKSLVDDLHSGRKSLQEARVILAQQGLDGLVTNEQLVNIKKTGKANEQMLQTVIEEDENGNTITKFRGADNKIIQKEEVERDKDGNIIIDKKTGKPKKKKRDVTVSPEDTEEVMDLYRMARVQEDQMGAKNNVVKNFKDRGELPLVEFDNGIKGYYDEKAGEVLDIENGYWRDDLGENKRHRDVATSTNIINQSFENALNSEKGYSTWGHTFSAAKGDKVTTTRIDLADYAHLSDKEMYAAIAEKMGTSIEDLGEQFKAIIDEQREKDPNAKLDLTTMGSGAEKANFVTGPDGKPHMVMNERLASLGMDAMNQKAIALGYRGQEQKAYAESLRHEDVARQEIQRRLAEGSLTTEGMIGQLLQEISQKISTLPGAIKDLENPPDGDQGDGSSSDSEPK